MPECASNGAHLQERVEDDLRDAAFVDVAALEEHLGGALPDPAGDDERAAPCALLLGRRRLNADVQIRGSGMTLVEIRQGL